MGAAHPSFLRAGSAASSEPAPVAAATFDNLYDEHNKTNQRSNDATSSSRSAGSTSTIFGTTFTTNFDSLKCCTTISAEQLKEERRNELDDPMVPRRGSPLRRRSGNVGFASSSEFDFVDSFNMMFSSSDRAEGGGPGTNIFCRGSSAAGQLLSSGASSNIQNLRGITTSSSGGTNRGVSFLNCGLMKQDARNAFSSAKVEMITPGSCTTASGAAGAGVNNKFSSTSNVLNRSGSEQRISISNSTTGSNTSSKNNRYFGFTTTSNNFAESPVSLLKLQKGYFAGGGASGSGTTTAASKHDYEQQLEICNQYLPSSPEKISKRFECILYLNISSASKQTTTRNYSPAGGGLNNKCTTTTSTSKDKPLELGVDVNPSKDQKSLRVELVKRNGLVHYYNSNPMTTPSQKIMIGDYITGVNGVRFNAAKMIAECSEFLNNDVVKNRSSGINCKSVWVWKNSRLSCLSGMTIKSVMHVTHRVPFFCDAEAQFVMQNRQHLGAQKLVMLSQHRSVASS
ncbi:unnamed protein product [Amoebophrya sp. A120]|nr:unnamed protein product [Amoebophrya sp. A120]|eukprot:GSA120T00012396001.1